MTLSSAGRPLLAACLLLPLAGCGGGDVDLEGEPVSFMGEQSASMIPIMLNNKTIKQGSVVQKLNMNRIINVELVEITDKQPDGTMTAHVTFGIGETDPIYDAEVKVTYQMKSERNEAGLDVVTYPIKNIETISLKRSGGG